MAKDDEVWVIQAKWKYEKDEWSPCAFGPFFTRQQARDFITSGIGGTRKDVLMYRVVRYAPLSQ